MRPKYLHDIEDHQSDLSPSIVVPIVMRLFNPASIVDVGCGIGNWMKEFKKNGVKDIFGIDGFHLDKSLFLNDTEELLLLDLEKPFTLPKRYDMAISLEVAEHLSEESATDFVKSLCNISDIVLFSAAVPGQGGQNHKNEQWPSWWKKKFEDNGYVFHDALRPVLWNNKSVKHWYKQNMFIATKEKLTVKGEGGPVIDFIHPELLTTKLNEAIGGEFGVKIAFRTFLNSISLAIKSRRG